MSLVLMLAAGVLIGYFVGIKSTVRLLRIDFPDLFEEIVRRCEDETEQG